MLSTKNNIKSECFKTPILLIVFNRPNTTIEVFNAIRNIKPSKLYIFSDGPRIHIKDELKNVLKVRELVSHIDWPCELNTLFHGENQGCKVGVSSAIDWFFSKEEMGIILEDDCLPANDFFTFCEEMLFRYSDNLNIFSISGNCFQSVINRNYSYHFSKYIHIWGWATWRRAWIKNDLKLQFWPNWKQSKDWSDFILDRVERKYWEKLFDSAYKNEIDTWDYSWIASVWFNSGLSITPYVNLVSNIGFDSNATHTKNSDSKFSNLSVGSMQVINYNDCISPNIKADKYTFNVVFEGYKLRWPIKYIYSLKRFLVRLIK